MYIFWTHKKVWYIFVLYRDNGTVVEMDLLIVDNGQ